MQWMWMHFLHIKPVPVPQYSQFLINLDTPSDQKRVGEGLWTRLGKCDPVHSAPSVMCQGVSSTTLQCIVMAYVNTSGKNGNLSRFQLQFTIPWLRSEFSLMYTTNWGIWRHTWSSLARIATKMLDLKIFHTNYTYGFATSYHPVYKRNNSICVRYAVALFIVCSL